MRIRSLAKADSVEFLDLCAPEFHETRNTTLIYALDLSVAPQRYYYIPDWFDETRDETVVRLTSRLKNGDYPSLHHLDGVSSTCSTRKLIEVARLNDWESYSALCVFFIDSIINGFESVSRNWESERIRIYLKYVKAYCCYVEESIIVPHECSGNIILTFERPPIVYSLYFSSWAISKIKNRLAGKLIQTLFENNNADSSLTAETFLSDRIGYQRIGLLFALEAKVTEYLLNHLKREMYDIGYMFETLQERSVGPLLRSNPKHLAVFLNYGFKMKFQLHTLQVKFIQLYPSFQHVVWNNGNFVPGRWSHLSPRENAILDIIVHFLTFNVIQFAIYLNSVRYTWRSIPDAFITYEEMRTLMVRNAIMTYAKYISSSIQKRDVDTFDTILQPRSLTHYSRCVIRDALIQNSQLPEGIELLALPSRLKSYLRLEF